MKIGILKARVSRNKFDEYAGGFFRDDNSQIVKELNTRNKKAILGIQRDDGVYTILGEEFVYYQTVSKIEGEISLAEFLKIMGNYARSIGKTTVFEFEFIKINNRDSVWVFNTETMLAMWNLMQMLHQDSVSK